MFLPDNLLNQLEKLWSELPLEELKRAAVSLSNNYRNLTPSINSSAERFAYLAFRMPATYAVLHKLFLEIKLRMPGEQFNTFLDLGTGPGTGLWAMADHFSSFQATLIDADREFLTIGKKLSKALAFEKEIIWKHESLFNDSFEFPSSDLVLFSYSLNELPEKMLYKVIDKALSSTQKCLLIVEPGTSKGFEKLLKVREYIAKSQQFSILAPCPHFQNCPLNGSSDWCHFYQRVERTFWHQTVKSAELPFEDEKYCYLLVSKIGGIKTQNRLIEKPQKRSGHILYKSCNEQGIENLIVSKKKHPELYPLIKKADWGDDIYHLN